MGTVSGEWLGKALHVQEDVVENTTLTFDNTKNVSAG